MNKKLKKISIATGVVICLPIVLFLLLALIIYIPPVQNWAVKKVAASLSEEMKMDIGLESVRLAFPLDLALHGVRAVEDGDTLLSAKSVLLDVQLLPLFKGCANVDGLKLYHVTLDSKSYVSDTHIKGRAALLEAKSHGIDWVNGKVHIDRARLRDADFLVELSDTAAEDTTSSKTEWLIEVARADIERSKVRLSMPGDSMRIGASLGQLTLKKGKFDLGKNYYAVHSLLLRDCGANYDLPHEKPSVGLDPNHISLSQISLILDTVSYNADGVLRAGLRRAALQERSGLAVSNLSGGIYMDSLRLILPALNFRTPHSRLDASLAFDFRTFDVRRPGKCSALIDASFGRADLITALRGQVPDDVLQKMPASLLVKGEVSGNARHLDCRSLSLSFPGIVSLDASGYVRNVMEERRSGQANFSLVTRNLSVVRSLLPKSVTQTVHVPDGITARGNVAFNGADYRADLRAGLGNGSLTAHARTNLKRETYQLSANASAFPLNRFLPSLHVSPFTGTLRASGAGFDIMSPRASLTADAQVRQFAFAGHQLGGISADAKKRGEQLTCDLRSEAAPVKGTATLQARLGQKNYEAALKADLSSIDLLALGVSKDTMEAATLLELQASANSRFTVCSAGGSLKRNRFSSPKKSMMAKNLLFDFSTAPDTTTLHISAGDLFLRAGTQHPLSELGGKISNFITALTRQMKQKDIHLDLLREHLPVLAFTMDAGRDNPLYNVLRFKGYSFSGAHVNLQTDPRSGISGNARVGALHLEKLLLDTIETKLFQDSTGVQLAGYVKNEKKKNPTPFELRLKAFLLNKGAGLEMAFFDSKGVKGVDLGMEAEVVKGGLQMHLYPHNPILAYRRFTVNKDNFLFLGRDKSIKADIDLVADDGTALRIYGEPKYDDSDPEEEGSDPSLVAARTDSVKPANDLTLSVNHVNLGELSAVLPYLPRLTGMLSGDVHVTDDISRKKLSAVASLQADDLTFEGTPLGKVGVEAIYLPKGNGEHHASAFISSGEEEVMEVNGVYFDREGGTYEGTARLHDFPLQLLNGFLVGTDMALKGIAEGELEVKGAADRPILNGKVGLRDAHIFSDVYGFDFRTDSRELELKDGRLMFENYNLYSTGKNPLVLNGVFDMSDFSRMAMDFRMNASDFELINTKKKPQSMVFGKVYANCNGTMKGTLDDLSIRARLEVLNRTDMTYILKDSPLSVDDRLSSLVQFVSFEDSLKSEVEPPTPVSSFDMVLTIGISDAALFHCDLSEDGQSYVDLEGGGDLTMRMTESGEMRLTGRFTVNSGEMKYALPVIPLKTFTIEQGSYVEFTGDVMNPTLNIVAKERTKALVTESEDNQRSVAFDVGVKLTKPLSDMGLEFTIEAPEDLSVQNELAAMSAEQRGKAAVTLMATGMYMTDETMMQGSGFKANNALNAFLQSEIQQIAGSALKTIDISLGVESGTSEVGTSTTDYSFRFAKRFWGNRISVIIGGKVSTGADATNSAESFISNVSVEYRLDRGSTRYVKAFYDRDTQDPLEGQLTRTGAGLVLRRKTERLGELFIFKNKKK